MVQVRKLVLAIAAASALSSGMAQALGLGGLTVKSTLNQPLLAEIELTEVQDLNASQVVPSLATSAEFAQAGVGRVAILDDLTFTPVVNPGGRSVLRITSTKPIRDPYVKFLVQVLWPNGRALREYSLLLDPPKFSPQAAAAAAQLPSTAPSAAPAPAPAAETPAAAPSTPAPAPAPEPKFTQYTTANNDTLWEIAARVKNGGTVQQTMLAIQALNPDAFIAGNINRLKKGQVLRLPSPQESTALAQPRAVAEVAEQNRAWREGRRLPSGARQVDATRRDRAGAAPSQIDAKDNLSLVSANKAGAKGKAGDNSDISNQLATTQENLDTTRRDNAELKSRMTDLQSQVDKLQRLIQLKNDQLAKMQASGAAVPPPTDAANPANPAVSPNSVTNPNNAANPAMQAQVVPSAAAPDVAGKAPDEIAPEDALPVDGAAVTSATPDQALIVPTEPVVDEDNRSALDKILASPMLMGLIGGGALLVLLLLLLLLARRRNALIEAERHRQMARALSEESDFASDMDMPASSFEGLETPAPLAKTPSPTVAEPAREHPADALVQAEIHIAYGRTNQAAAVLEDAIKHEPQRSDLRLKLMEVYAEQDNKSGFVAQERQLVATGKNHAEVEELKSRYPSMAAAAAAVAGVAAASALAAEMDAKYVEELLHDEPEVPAQPAPVAETVTEVPLDEEFDNAFDLSLDDLDSEPPAVAPNRAAAQDNAALDDLDLDAPFAGSASDDLDFDAILREQQATSGPAEPADLDDFDLNLAEDQPALKAEDDYLLGMEDDLRDLPPFEQPASLGADKPGLEDDIELPADFDLSLADEMETEQASEAFASEIDDVNAELDRLSQSLEQPPIAKPFDTALDKPVDASPRFTEDDALLADDEPEFDFLSGTDEAATKLDLARAYIEMGDADGARDILDEVVAEGDDGQKTEARDMLSRLV
ncbi:FimV/HubP family polar landmark protein [Pseudomonas graminis]|uniref:Pilus assembly protein FimV n=1 Tax=Pseudomonas graminis TaxID=158627 RepID=A0A1I0DG25_9PSED|nr:FimV/HubP family polar landmark protein [Pseudomonas graminis]SET30733.1 pilus assembly protein FimV [Pseudomonas graminis]